MTSDLRVLIHTDFFNPQQAQSLHKPSGTQWELSKFAGLSTQWDLLNASLQLCVQICACRGTCTHKLTYNTGTGPPKIYQASYLAPWRKLCPYCSNCEQWLTVTALTVTSLQYQVLGTDVNYREHIIFCCSAGLSTSSWAWIQAVTLEVPPILWSNLSVQHTPAAACKH